MFAFVGAIHTSCIAFVVLIAGILLSAVNIYELQNVQGWHNVVKTQSIECEYKKPVLWLHGKSGDNGHLKHVIGVFERLGYTVEVNASKWDVLWSHEYPFNELRSNLTTILSHQKVNHFPGCGYITNKVSLSTSGSSHIPKAFQIPEDKDALLKYAQLNPEMLFIQKKNTHRGIKIEKLDSIDLNSSGSFVQEYISNPLLIDGYKFDVGIYTILTSIDPLRVYYYSGDVLFRFCPEKYHPFDPSILDKYVIGDDYLPIWNVPSLKNYYNNLGFSMKESFNAYIASIGKDPNKIWKQINEAIANLYLLKEPLLSNLASQYNYKHNFFEMVRIDFIIDENLNVYMLEANMSPNLSSAHYPPNRLLYEQVIYNLLSLVGVGSRVNYNEYQKSPKGANEMQVAYKNLAVEAKKCSEKICRSCLAPHCLICKQCLTAETLEILKDSFLEHENRLAARRIFPPAMNSSFKNDDINMEDLSPENQFMYNWFQGKCNMDVTWCE